MRRFKLLVYTSDPAAGARPSREYEVIAESRSHATKLLMDQLGELGWRVLQAADLGDASDVETPQVDRIT